MEEKEDIFEIRSSRTETLVVQTDHYEVKFFQTQSAAQKSIMLDLLYPPPASPGKAKSNFTYRISQIIGWE